jgi:rhombotail lipoprotein
MRRSFVLLLLPLLLTACVTSRQTRRSSNLMSYLYPNKTSVAPAPQGARLQLPIRVGVAFVPSATSGSTYVPVAQSVAPAELEARLVGILKKAFTGRDWVGNIVTIPSSYLVPGGGFDNLEQVAQLFNVDVIALVSVDQIQSSDTGRLSFLYISVIGAYTLPLERNDTRTLIDAAVFHVPTHTLLLRAPGTSHIEGRSTAMDINVSLRDKSVAGLQRAMNDLSKNLDTEVGAFKASVVTGERTDVEVINGSGTSIRTSGSFGWRETLAAAFLALAFVWKRSH